jgi:DNA polymerase-3 subunit epsilon
MSILDEPLAFIDIETTGGSPRHARLLEVAVIRVENHRVVGEYQQLVDPGGWIPAAITQLTGIRDDDITSAPTFRTIADELHEILDGAIFVAHNVQFDYGFINMEFDQIGVRYDPRLLDTVRLSRRLYPGVSGHSLAAIIERFKLTTKARHRAYDDAKVLWDFYRIMMAEFDLDTIEAAVYAQPKARKKA